jgi:competence ComEA-like helix-hairpin-helix protein
MHADETRALKRAVLILLLVSAARWGWSQRAEPAATADASVLPELLEGTREAAEEGARRKEPLADGETIDPNRASDVELDRLPGVGPATARAIVAAREEGRVFRRPEDLLEVRGIGDATLERMRERLAFGPLPPGAGSRPGGAPPTRPASVDVNRASAQDLERLPGIGPSLAERVVAARRERMFTSVDDLERVPGIGPATLERLRPHIVVGPIR